MEGKTFYLIIRGQRVEVTEEVYRAYVRPVRKERKRQYRAIGKYSVYSVESIIANGIEVIDENADCESALIEEEERQEELDLLRAALEKLEGRDREIIAMVYFEGKTHEEVAHHFGVSRAAISRRISKILKIFKDFFLRVLPNRNFCPCYGVRVMKLPLLDCKEFKEVVCQRSR